jgi:hypothetical protein
LKRQFVVPLISAAALLVPAGPAFAIHCKVADKPLGAGSTTPDDWKIAGESGQVVIPGAFVNIGTVFPGEPNEDVFVRGRDFKEIGEEELGTAGRSFGSLPEQDPGPHTNGPEDHGVVSLP